MPSPKLTDNIYNPAFVKELFNRMSGSYERVNYITSFGFSIRWRKQFVPTFTSGEGALQIIDLMTGMGETWNAVMKMYPNAQLTGLDFSSEMLKGAHRKNDTQFDKKINLLQQDILQNELPDNHYDIVICAFGLKTFNKEQLKTLATETYRILKPGGQFSFIEVSKPDNALLRALFQFYLGKIIPLFGKLLLGNPSEYRMLWRYTDRFQNAREAGQVFQSVGLQADHRSYFYGCATGFMGRK